MQIDLIRKLRDKTGAGVMDCRRALLESEGDFEKAVLILREKGIEVALKKSSREVKEGLVESYVHLGGKLGVLVEINCETDFVARNELFRKFSRDVAMQIAASNPSYIGSADVPQEVLDKEKALLEDTLRGRTKEDIDKAWKSHLIQFNRDNCLLEQPFIRDEKIIIKDYLNSVIAQFGENIKIRRFVRYQLGD